MSDTLFNFDKRVRRISRRNRKLARGHVNYIDSTGIIRQRARLGLGGLPIRGLLLIAFSFFCFKGLLIAHQGSVQYNDRLTLLQEGTIFEQAAGWAMQIEPVSLKFAAFLSILV